jgi:nucleoid-associated protein YgaU
MTSKPTTEHPRTYTVQKGDTLTKLARLYYGDGRLFTKIYNANRDKLADPADEIHPGDVLVIPD